MSFVHLHTHTEYSLLDGLTRVGELVARAKELEMPAVAITDHGSMFGVAEFYRKARQTGIKPIIGCEVYVAKGSRLEKTKGQGMNHLILLAKNNTGYRNLCKLVSEAYLTGFYYKPRIDLDLLEEHAEGLVALSACLKGEIPEAILNNNVSGARQAALRFQSILGKDNFFLEMQDHGIREEKAVLPEILKMSREMNIPAVATNDIHYLHKQDSDVHDVLLCIQTNKQKHDASRMRYEAEKFYLKTREEMEALFGTTPEILDNTLHVADMCDVELPSSMMLPDFEVPDGETLDSYLQKISEEGLGRLKDQGRLRSDIAMDTYRERLQTELDVLKLKGFSGYFLITWDFVRYAREEHIPVGPGRGSAAGSLVAFSLGITDVDPLRYGLLFERFLNPERTSMPDVDIDFCKNRREEVISYVKQKYGEDRVSQIVTFNKMKAKLAIKDVARVLGYAPEEANRVTTKLYPPGLNIDIKTALNDSEELRKYRESSEQNRQLFDYVERIEGTARHPGVHAAGVIIAPRPIVELAPVFVDSGSKSPVPVVQYDKDEAENIGLLKMDFLGLKTLSIIDVALNLIEERHGVPRTEVQDAFSRFDDEKVFQVFCHGDTQAIFQFESSGMQNLLKQLQPDKLEDLIACNAMYRPGPIGSGMLDSYIRRRNGLEDAEYPLPGLEPFLEETYGIILYQEQVMQIAVEIAGYSMGQADLLRKAMGKKKDDVMAKQREIFLKGAEEKGHDLEKARALFDLMAEFAKYGFNKSHSAAYAILAYQTGYLKAYYPTEFATAVLRMEQESTASVEDILKFKPMLERMNIRLLPPDINLSGNSFTIVNEGILFGLGAVKGVGSAAIDVIVEERKSSGNFKNFDDFLERIDTRKVNKKVVESLVIAGAFDGFGDSRKHRYDTLEVAMRFAARKSEEKKQGLRSLFDDMPEEPSEPREHEEWDKLDLLEKEAEVLGYYASGHPLDEVAGELRRFSTISTAGILTLMDEAVEQETQTHPRDAVSVTIGGMIRSVSFRQDRRGRRMASFTLEDLNGRVKVMVFASKFPGETNGRNKNGIPNINELLQEGNRVFVSGKLDLGRGSPSILLDNMEPFDEFIKEGASAVTIRIHDGTRLNELKAALAPYRGTELKLFFTVRVNDRTVWVRAGDDYNLSSDIMGTSVIRDAGFDFTVR